MHGAADLATAFVPRCLGGGTGCCFSPLPLLPVLSSVTPPRDHAEVGIPLPCCQERLFLQAGVPCQGCSLWKGFLWQGFPLEEPFRSPGNTELRLCRTQGPRLL